MVLEKYQSELNEFRENFAQYKEKKIVLYGIGRYSATLVEGLTDFNFVGLMDKDENNLGKTMFDLPIVSLAQAEQIADLIVINTSGTYWNVIFERIQDSKIPVFFKNGERAQKKNARTDDYTFKNLSLQELRQKAYDADIVSFDFFDTLFSRAVSNPRDVFKLVPIKNELRIEAKNALKENYNLDELYCKMVELGTISEQQSHQLKQREIELEKKLLTPRTAIFDLFVELLNAKKQVFIVSDMYLSADFYVNVLAMHGVKFERNNIFVSCEQNACKRDGTLWAKYAKDIAKGKNALHIGDDITSDVNEPQKYGIQSYHTPSNWQLLTNGDAANLASNCCKDYDSRLLALVANKLYQNPYRDAVTNGALHIATEEEMGYVVFGPLILTMLIWLQRMKKAHNTEQLLFLARDGYLLKDCYEHFCAVRKIDANCLYLVISRQLAMMASCNTKEDIIEYMSMPYSGNVQELFEDRLGIKIAGGGGNRMYKFTL